ncbi:hypothetical protein [Haloferula sargassicola]|uniref:hypothetical protein n=1 Tax=Haloferula sargassicola TaxID=490096 RepID=UPI0033658756
MTILGCRIGIHAAKTRRGISALPQHEITAAEEALGIPQSAWDDRLPFGSLVATTLVEASIPTGRLTPDLFGDFTPGRFGWFLSGTIALSMPIPTRGCQGIFFTPDPH